MSIYDDIPEIEKPGVMTSLGRGAGSGISRAAGMLFGIANAPLAFIKGAMNAPTYNPEEYGKMGPISTGLTLIGGGLESAKRSISQEGDWGEQYDQYFAAKTGSTLEKEFGANANYIRFGLDLMMDPLFGPALAVDLASKGVRTVGQFGKYISKGEIALGANQIVKMPRSFINDVQRLNARDAAERIVARQNLVDTLNNRIETKVQEALNAPPEMWDYGDLLRNEGLQREALNIPREHPYFEEFSPGLYDDMADKAFLGSHPEMDEYTKHAYLTSIEKERSLQKKMYEGRVPVIPLADRNPELAKELENFLDRGRGNKWIWKEDLPGEGIRAAPKIKSVSGLVVGFDEDEEGNLTYDIKKGLLGTIAVAGGIKLSGGRSRAYQQQGTIFTKLMSSNPTARVAQTSKDIWALFDLQTEEMAKRTALTWQKIKGRFTNLTYDISGNIKAAVKKIDPVFGRELQMRQELVTGASTKAANMIGQYNAMVFDGLSSDQTQILNQIIRSKANAAIDVAKGQGAVKHTGGYTGTEYQQSIDDLQQILPQEIYADLNARADLFGEALAEQLKMRFDEGLLTQDGYQSLMSRYYSPRQFFQHLEDQRIVIQGKISVPEKHIKTLQEGSEEFLWNDNQELLAQTVNRTQDLIFKNRANNALFEFAQANPGNGIAKEAQIVKYTKKGAPVYEDVPAGHQSVGVFLNGDHKPIFMKNEYADEWIKNDPLHNSMVVNLLQWISGSKPVKLLATGLNPLFALRNIPRDLSLIYMQADSPYSLFAPSAMGQMAKDMTTVAKDVFTRSGRVQDFINEGGGLALQTYYGRWKGEGFIGEKLAGFEKYAGWIGETSELWTRLALRERALHRGMSSEMATWQARKYLDFSQGGSLIKALDIGIPYLNARIQGTRSLFRAAKDDKGLFMWKLANLMTVSAGLYFANQAVNPEGLRQTSDRDKAANFIITTPLSYVDSDGQTRYLEFKIAKSEEQQIATSFIDALLSYYIEGKYPTQQMLMAISQLTGVGLPPTISALIALAGNLDTWTWQKAWKGSENIEAGQQYTTQTHPAMKAIGQLGISPDKFATAAGKIIPPNNFFVGLAGGGLATILNQFDPPEKQKLTAELLMANPAIRTVLTSTSPYNEYRLEHRNLIMAETTRRHEQTREVDAMSEMFFRDRNPQQGDKIQQFIESQPESDQERLIGRVERYSQTAQLPDRKWWIEVGQMDYQTRAKAFLSRFDKEESIGKLRMFKLSDTISGFHSDDFINAIIEAKGGI